MSNSILIGCHFLAFDKFWWLLLAVDELVRGFVWPCFVCYVQIRCCVAECCWVLVQDRCQLGVAFFPALLNVFLMVCCVIFCFAFPPFLVCCFCSRWFCRFAPRFTACVLLPLAMLADMYLNYIV